MNENDMQTFDPETDIGLDLSKDEKLRATALLLATRYYVETICKDGGLYKAMVKSGITLKPATSESIVRIACEFAAFLRGDPSDIKSIELGGKQIVPDESVSPPDKEKAK